MGKKKKKKSSAKTLNQKVSSTAIRENLGMETIVTVVENYAFWFLLGTAPLIFFMTGRDLENYPKMAFLQWGIALISLFVILRGGKDSFHTWKRSPLDILIILFYGAGLFSVFFSVNPFQSVTYLLQWGAAVIFYFFLV